MRLFPFSSASLGPYETSDIYRNRWLSQDNGHLKWKPQQGSFTNFNFLHCADLPKTDSVWHKQLWEISEFLKRFNKVFLKGTNWE